MVGYLVFHFYSREFPSRASKQSKQHPKNIAKSDGVGNFALLPKVLDGGLRMKIRARTEEGGIGR
jgi:hypothetical protein